MTVLVVTAADDVHADVVAAKLRARGREVVRFDPADGAAIELRFAGDELQASIGELDLRAVAAVWYRRPGRPRAPEPYGAFAARQTRETLAMLWEALPCAAVPARPSVTRAAGSKWLQLRLARRLGLVTPATLVTNRRDAVVRFFSRHDGRIISKLVASTWLDADTKPLRRLTEPVTHRDLAHLDDLEHAPAIFQEQLAKAVEIRATVVGDRVFAAEIRSQATHRTRLDWRRYDDRQTPYAPHGLPAAIERACVAICRELGLVFGAIDLVVTPAGDYIFLELNPNGQWLFVEDRTGQPISDAIAELLC